MKEGRRFCEEEAEGERERGRVRERGRGRVGRQGSWVGIIESGRRKKDYRLR